ncbi:MAG TPA: DUF4124 domain-containing protein [Steroidobacteraceae bacterium]|nr:DUF4124 domain-containing protein [Steroidobacteraceae bacterium]
MRRLVFTLMSLACTAAFATTIYKWVDENGVVHYSDQPHPNAQKLQISGAQTFSSSAAAVPAPNQSSDDSNAQTNPYRGCVIASPQDQQSLPNAQSVFLRVQSDPLPRAGDRVFITLDGQGVNGGQATGLSYNVSPIDRGAHSVQAQIRGPGDQVLCQTPTVTFYVQQPNLFSPAGPNTAQPVPNPRPH